MFILSLYLVHKNFTSILCLTKTGRLVRRRPDKKKKSALALFREVVDFSDLSIFVCVGDDDLHLVKGDVEFAHFNRASVALCVSCGADLLESEVLISEGVDCEGDGLIDEDFFKSVHAVLFLRF